MESSSSLEASLGGMQVCGPGLAKYANVSGRVVLDAGSARCTPWCRATVLQAQRKVVTHLRHLLILCPDPL